MKSIKDVYKIGSGPSSSHTIGPENACKYILDNYEFDEINCTLYGSLAFTGKGHLTDYIIKKTLGDRLGEITFDLHTKELEHPNTMRFDIFNKGEVEQLYVYSIGGGDIDIVGVESKQDKDVYPHNTMQEINEYLHLKKMNYVEYVCKFDPDGYHHLYEVWKVMVDSIKEGLSIRGVLPGELEVVRRAKQIYENHNNEDDMLLSSFAYAVNEQNASGNTVVTAPTCGACGVVPSLFYFLQQKYDFTTLKIIDALAVAGLFGAIVKNNASISGAEAGCQAEVGTATAMAAAGANYLLGGNIRQVESAAEIGLEHQLGLTCDPILGYVQVPCIQRNVVGASKALLASKLAMQISVDEIVSFDNIVEVMYNTGKDMASEYRETAMGGLAKLYEERKKIKDSSPS